MVAYAWHPWAGHLVHVHEVLAREAGAWARCSLVGADVTRLREIPTWMLDASACRTMRPSAEPVAALSALVALRKLLAEAVEAATAGSSGAAVACTPSHHGGRHAPPPSPDLGRQPDLFLPTQPWTAAGSPGWRSLPEAARQAVTALMARLLISHAAGATPEPEGEADER